LRKALILTLALVLVVALIVIVGCSGDDERPADSDDEISIGTYERDITVEDGDGEASGQAGEEEREPSEEDLGVHIYPGAEYVPGTGVVGYFAAEGGVLWRVQGQWTTADGYDKVVAWYADTLGEQPSDSPSTGGVVWRLTAPSGTDSTTLYIVPQGDKVLLDIYRVGPQ